MDTATKAHVELGGFPLRRLHARLGVEVSLSVGTHRRCRRPVEASNAARDAIDDSEIVANLWLQWDITCG